MNRINFGSRSLQAIALMAAMVNSPGAAKVAVDAKRQQKQHLDKFGRLLPNDQSKMFIGELARRRFRSRNTHRSKRNRPISV